MTDEVLFSKIYIYILEMSFSILEYLFFLLIISMNIRFVKAENNTLQVDKYNSQPGVGRRKSSAAATELLCDRQLHFDDAFRLVRKEMEFGTFTGKLSRKEKKQRRQLRRACSFG